MKLPSLLTYIIIRDYEKATCMLIDVAISGDRNVINKPRCKDLTTEIQRK